MDNHELVVDDEGYQIVVCPLTNPDTGEGFRTTWSPNAESSEHGCLFCEWAAGEYPLNPDHGDGDAQ